MPSRAVTSECDFELRSLISGAELKSALGKRVRSLKAFPGFHGIRLGNSVRGLTDELDIDCKVSIVGCDKSQRCGRYDGLFTERCDKV
jgi:hypothetical protein